VDEFRAAWEKPGFVKLTKAVDGAWAGTGRQEGYELPFETLPPPMSVETSKRYSVDKDNHYASWMDFSFYLAFDRDNGLKFFNIEYKGERIIYELGKSSTSACVVPTLWIRLTQCTPRCPRSSRSLWRK